MARTNAAEFDDARRFLAARSTDKQRLQSWACWTEFRAKGIKLQREWVYLYRFGPVFSWGTATGNGNRLRNACMFHMNLAGKYDRRVDYLMLRLIHAEPAAKVPETWVFEYAGKAHEVERQLMRRYGQAHCYGGFDPGCCRLAISEHIHARFKQTTHYQNLSEAQRSGFETFMREVFFAQPPHKNHRGVTFKYGDTLEPWFLREIGHPRLEPAIEAALDVRFPEPGSKCRSPLR